ncbi:MAG: YceI family protein [Pseudomonadota bacterium]
MKRLSIALAIVALPVAAVAQVESYTLDQPHTFPYFALDYLGYANILGRFDRTSGKFSIDQAAKKASLELAVETASVTTGDSERAGRPRTRDEHLRTPDFFNVIEFPRMTYKSSNVRFSGDSPAEVEGQLTLLGVTKPLTLKIDRFVCKVHPFYKKPACGGNASGTIKRTDFGMKYAVPALGDEVRISIIFLGLKE